MNKTVTKIKSLLKQAQDLKMSWDLKTFSTMNDLSNL